MQKDRSACVARVAQAIAAGDIKSAVALLNAEYPFARQPRGSRRYGVRESTRIFLRDGFIDRYSGCRLVCPGALRFMSLMMPAEFPYHVNWRSDMTHPAYWELSPTIDHGVPVARGGIDAHENWFTTSMLRNSAKGNWTLEELGWQLHPAGSINDWDGLLGWFLAAAESFGIGQLPHGIRSWYLAGRAELAAV